MSPVITMLGVAYLAEVFSQLTLVALLGQIWALPFLIYLNVVDTSKVNRWVIWAVTTLLLSYPNGKRTAVSLAVEDTH
jgi:hypothetical protein